MQVYKRLLMVSIIVIFLITSVGAISAADDISVKVVWDGGDTPDYVTVNLLKDGKIVDTAKLSSENSWKTTFKVDDEGDYQVSEVDSSDYSSSISGSAESGFVITNTILKEDVLSASEDDSLEDSSADDDLSQDDTPALTENETAPEENYTTEDVNSTDVMDDNSTEDDNATDNDTTTEEITEIDADVTVTSETTKVVKKDKKPADAKVAKKDKNNTKNITKSKNNNTGFPVVALICAVFVAAFVPFSRKK